MAFQASGQASLKLLRDINVYQENPYPYDSPPSSFSTSIATLNGITYFLANEPETGLELWKTDGTISGASLVKDITPGPASSNISGPVATQNRLFLILNKNDLWTSDGTAAGTYLLKDFEGTEGIAIIQTINSIIFFSAHTASSGRELWKSDGTASGTVMVKDLNPGSGNGVFNNYIKINSTIFFSGNNGESDPSSNLWKTDGTSAGTVRIDATFPFNLRSPREFTNVGGVLYFIAGGSFGYEDPGLYRTDGTQAGTVKITIPGGGVPKMYSLSSAGENAYFIVTQPQSQGHNYQLWRVQPGQTQASLVKNLYPYPYKEPENFVSFKDELYFTAWDSLHGYEVWKSNGTAEGTKILKDINPGPAHGIGIKSSEAFPHWYSYVAWPYFKVAGDYLYFISAQNDFLLTRTDGTAEGTTVVKDIGDNVVFSQLVSVGSSLYFVANDYVHGYALWKTDGIGDNTLMLKDLTVTHAPTSLGYGTFFNGYYYFSAHDGAHGQELWRTNGSTQGTTLVRDLLPGRLSSSPYFFLVSGNSLYFLARDMEHGVELWKSDGTGDGTQRVTSVSIESNQDVDLSFLDTVNNKLIFYGRNNKTDRRQWWVSDGTANGTAPITGLSNTSLNYPFNANGYILFGYLTAGHGIELWKTDGTVEGTVLLKDINPGVNGSGPTSFYKLNNIVYFTAFEPGTGWEFYRTDGTPQGTYMVKDVCPGTCSSLYFLGFTSIKGTLYFTAHDAVKGYCMFKSDGTSDGTVFLNDPVPGYQWAGGPMGYRYVNGKIMYEHLTGASDYSSDDLWAMDENTGVHQKIFTSSKKIQITGYIYKDRYYFVNNDIATGAELWKTDGTTAGTSIVRDINIGAASSSPEKIKLINDAMYFITLDASRIYTLWKSNGEIIKKIIASPGRIRDYFVLNNKMLLHIEDPQYGEEYFYYDLADEPALIPPVSQVISFNEIPVKKLGDDPFNLAVTSSSGLAVTLESSDPAIASVSGHQVTILQTGQVIITATQEGNEDYSPATPVSKTLSIENIVTGIEFNHAGIRLFPNPTSANLKIEANESVEHIFITDMLGNSQSVNETEDGLVNIEAFSSGIYFVTITTLSRSVTIKVIKR